MTYEICDTVLLDEKFDIKNVNTWLNPFVKFFINLWHKVNGTPYIHYSHCGKVAMYENELYFWESVKDGFLPTKKVSERFIGIENRILILRHKDYLSREDKEKTNQICKEIYDADYDYGGIFSQLIYTSTNRTIWIGEDEDKAKILKKFYCVKSCCYIDHIINKKYFPNWAKCSQKDLYLSNHFQHIKHTNV